MRLVDAHLLPDVRRATEADHLWCMNAVTRTGRTKMSAKTWLQSLAGRRKDPRPARRTAPAPSLTIRYATVADAAALHRLAALDSARELQGTVLLAEVAGEPWAAVSLDDYHAVADPFRPTGELVWLLVQRARDLERTERRRSATNGGQRVKAALAR
jgi:hypothetical protein